MPSRPHLHGAAPPHSHGSDDAHRPRRRAGLAAFRLHDLRHFMATTTLAAGVPVPVVSERLCHARSSTTVNIYAHAMPGGDRAAVNLLAELLAPAPDRGAGLPAQTGGRRLVL
jgi:integrase